MTAVPAGTRPDFAKATSVLDTKLETRERFKDNEEQGADVWVLGDVLVGRAYFTALSEAELTDDMKKKLIDEELADSQRTPNVLADPVREYLGQLISHTFEWVRGEEPFPIQERGAN